MVSGASTPRVLMPDEDIGETPPRNALHPASASILTRWQGARSPYRAGPTCFSFIRARCWGQRHRRAQGLKTIPPFDYTLGVYAPSTLIN